MDQGFGQAADTSRLEATVDRVVIECASRQALQVDVSGLAVATGAYVRFAPAR
jgi:hypothetical protein